MKTLIKSTIGKILILILPRKAKELSNKGMTIVVGLTFIERLMRDILLEKARNKKDFETLSQFHQDFWENKGEEYFSTRKYKKVLEDFFIPQCSFLLDLLQEQLQNEDRKYNILVEIGTGEGTVLEHLSVKLPQIERFVGIDLSDSQIEVNKSINKNPKLEFVASDAIDWIKKNKQENMIIFTCYTSKITRFF